MPAYEAVIGLEVHVQLATATKLFCSCPTSFGQAPNNNVCEVCGGMPGALPMLNRQAVHYACLVGLATNCSIHRNSIFARKNYFYPDLPSGYQISQFDLPICEHGHLTVTVDGAEKRIGKPLEAAVTLRADDEAAKAALDDVQSMNLPELLIVSQCLVGGDVPEDAVTGTGTNFPGLHISVHNAPGTKCPRCWMHSEQADPETGLCPRCAAVVAAQQAE